MMAHINSRRVLSLCVGVLAVAVSADGRGANSNQGLTVQGLTVQGLTVQGLTVQGLTVQGLTVQGLTVQGLTVQGLTVQGLTVQGLTVQGLTVQGLTVQGVSMQGSDLLAADLKGVAIASVEMKDVTSTSAIQPHVLTNVPLMSAGPGNYITVGGGSAVGHYAVAHLVDAQGNPAEDLDLYIAGEQKDPVPNLIHRFEEQDNQDELYTVYFFNNWTGQWASLCPYNNATGSASAMAIPEDPSNPNQFIFACTATGVASKCARNWGYKPWSKAQAYVYDATADGGLGAWELQSFDLKPYYDVCKYAAQAGYCQDGRSYTKAGTQVDLFDTRQIIWPNAIENPWSASNDNSLWMMAQEYFISTGPSPLLSSLKDSALQRTRYRELSPVADCNNLPYIDRLEHDNVEDGRWASPLTNTPRLQVFSPTSCTHNEYEVGAALPWDCSPCTTQVCKTMPGCCGAGATPGWTAACSAYAATQCQTNGEQWTPGKVWPRDVPLSPAIPAKYLIGPGGAVTRVDGVSGSSSQATIAGWACDPEWAGAAVAVRIYGGGPREGGGTLLGEVRADQALAVPLAREVSAACDGPGRDYARHGFSFTLPLNQTGDVFVYAIDDETADGPAAPPTLVRNGIVPVPRCAHSEHVTGEMLDASCSTCAGSVCGDGSHGDCCSVEWTDACVVAANSCAPADSSAPVNDRSFAAVTTGWIEAPVTGSYTFESSLQPSRLFVNGTTVLDWFETSPGTSSGTITLQRGQRYHLRWDRLQTAEPPGPPNDGLTWQVPGTVGQAPIRTQNLYAIAPGGGSGLSATYYTGAGFVGGVVTRTDATVDINTDIAPPGPPPMDLPAGYGPSYSAVWEGDIVPSFTESYTFTVVGSGTANLSIDGAAVAFGAAPVSSAPGGCAHDLCTPGDKLDASCNSCVHDICDKDPYCCNGGYLSYYSTEPEWDARCIAEVAAYCGGSSCAPPPGPGSPQKKTVSVPLHAGVRYRLHFDYSNPTTDKTIRLLWSSPRQAKQVIPQFALLPPGPPNNAGSGLNVTYFATKSQNGVVKSDLSKVVASGAVADLSLTPAVGTAGLPLADVLAATVDATTGKPSPPSVTRPRFGDVAYVGAGGTTHVSGIGGITSGFVHITVEGGAGDVMVAVSANGHFEADVPIAVGPQKLKLVQQMADPCVAPACGVSKDVIWEITATAETAPGTAPIILSPTDPTHSAAAAPLVLNVVGTGTTGPVHVVDQGSVPDLIPDITPDSNGKFTAQITLDPGDAGNPAKGWHKLVFDQGGPASPPVFVSVGIDPPTVVFPRNGAQIDCDQPDQQGEQIAIGTLPYPQEVFGRLRVMEETGRTGLAFVGAETVVPQPQPGQPIVFLTHFNPGPGRHVVYFFQAPDPPAQATQDQIDAHFRAYARLADTPESRIVVERKPPRFPIPQGVAGVVGGRGITGGVFTNLPPPGQGPFLINITQCGPNANPPSPLCAQPFADVNIRIDGRLYTSRADADGAWSLNLPLAVGWNHVTFAQVSDSRVGGAWSESCLSNEVDFGVRESGGPVITVPPDITVNATSPKGAQVFYPDVTAVRASDGASVPVDCVPPTGSIFPLGRNEILCRATDPATGAVGLAEFAITVVAGPPEVKATNVTLEATSSVGATLNAYTNLSVVDVIDPTPAIDCVPAAPHLFLLDQVMPVVCTVTDRLNQTATAQFQVDVRDRTPPDPCTMPDLKVGTNSGSGAIVNYSLCKASDIVDGDVSMACDLKPGSFFPLGKTVVTCSATDRHGNKSASTSFTVSVGDTTPPVLKLPGTVSAIATSRSGARVSYTVTATDNVDPNPTVKCTPASGSIFPLGKTPVNCTATDAAGNKSTGTFFVKVTVAWTGFLAPVNQDGSSRFPLGLPIALRFALSGASANICDLTAKLFVAPLDAAGNPGTERPAVGLPPGLAGNLFYFIPIINQYAMLLDTRPLSLGPWQLRVDLGDGEIHTQRITMTRL
jgi:hypothetical protein